MSLTLQINQVASQQSSQSETKLDRLGLLSGDVLDLEVCRRIFGVDFAMVIRSTSSSLFNKLIKRRSLSL